MNMKLSLIHICKGKTRDVDEYNRRYDARDNEFVMDNDTLYIKEKSNPEMCIRDSVEAGNGGCFYALAERSFCCDRETSASSVGS